MEHDEAIRSQAAERYVSHELSPAEQESFEEHFFDCQECADDVRFELTFAANVRAVSREQQAGRQPAPEPPRAGSRAKWRDGLRPRPAMAFSFAANFLLAAGLGYVLLTGAHESTVARFTQPYFAPGPTKGAEDVHAIPAGDTSYVVRFPAPSATSQSYSYEVLDAAGKRQSAGSLKAPASEDGSLYLQVPVESLPGGVHTLAVRGGPGNEIVSWSKFRTSR
jgi:anti-sigma factor RsiW